MGRPYFEGWYLKQQNGRDTVAFIPARHTDRTGKISASLQIITNRRVWQLDYPGGALKVERQCRRVTLGDNWFSPDGCHIDCAAEGTVFHGDLRFTGRVELDSDIMGPFRFVPGMECRHSVFSMGHAVDGVLCIGGERMEFHSGLGYIEGDRGVSFPSRYLWTQCGWEDSAVMLSVAEIPLGALRFTGCIGAVLHDGKQYRFATYRGVRILRAGSGAISLRQGKMTLEATLLKDCPQPLRAPHMGGMTRIIRESAACQVRYHMTVGERTLFDRVGSQAGFESVWTPAG